MRKILCLLFVCIVSVQAYSQQALRGVDFTLLDKSFSRLDSAVLRRNSTMYSGKSAYGTASSQETIFFKFYNDKEKYYPVMKEAWKYCIDRIPYQLRLYRDGIAINTWMIAESTDSLSRAKYGTAIMEIYDRQIQNLDSINEHVKRVSDKSSKGNVMLQKTYAYATYVLGRNSDNYYSDEMKAVMYPMYRDAVNVIKQVYEAGDDNGGGESEGDSGLPYYLTEYFRYAYANFVDFFNASLADKEHANDSINKSIRENAKKSLLDEYNFIRDFSNRQIQVLGGDYVGSDTLNVDSSEDSIKVVLEKVVKPYQDMLNECTGYVQGVGINVNIQTLADADAAFYDDLESHKDSLEWLNRVKTLCENTTDFSPDNLYYSFYEDVVKYYDIALAEAKKRMSQKQVKRFEGNEYYSKSVPLYNAVVAWARSGRSADRGVINNALLAIYYLKQAKRTDPGNAAKYQRNISWLGQIRSEAFMAGVKEGQTITVNGVTFTASFQ